MAKECVLSTGNLLQGGLPGNSVDRITDRPDMTLAVDCGRKALTRPINQPKYYTFKEGVQTKKYIRRFFFFFFLGLRILRPKFLHLRKKIKFYF